ncbi:MAG: RagB/SusD family nutrient uptake outer membrane protein [Bacteroidales bacterium]|jgi:hypothetical protein|nr:RagB/SusD family nutrient uptake outer membrane protein [Bacteroidales bacterium]
MIYLKRLFILAVAIPCLIQSCQLIEPTDENQNTFSRIYSDPDYAEGMLMNAYIALPTNDISFNDVATDDAVSNISNNNYRRAAIGEWSSKYNPFDMWYTSNRIILYLNYFIDNVVDSVEWKWTNKDLSALYQKRLLGESYGLRALFQYYLLETVGGYSAGNELLGIPIYEKPFGIKDNEFKKPRATFKESVEHIYADIDKALQYLTMDKYQNITDPSQLPPGYEDVKSIANYNDVFGNRFNQRINGQFIKALKSRVALLAASPAFSDGDQQLWERAAEYAADVIDAAGGVGSMDPNGHRYYLGTYVDKLSVVKGNDQQEMILRRPISASNSLEVNNFPPSLFGNGSVNPSQNLVDAFPMANGYPINHAESGYDPLDPYKNRDPRLSLYIVYNKSKMSNKLIVTAQGGKIDAKDSTSTSTRTGYYLRKFIREDVNANPAQRNSKNHYQVHFRFTELFLIYAEAANEAWGPDGTGKKTFSARDVIAAIRKRGGIKQPDLYLASITNKEEMRNLIRNERRLELCFEGFRFWDLRRWKLNLTESVRGVNIDFEGNYHYVDVEERNFNNNYMHYGPLPDFEIIKFDQLIQNKGW